MGHMLTHVLIERKLSFHISTKTQLLELPTFSRLSSTCFSYVVAFKHV